MKTILTSVVVAFLGLSICAAAPEKGKGRKPHGGKPCPDWAAKKAEFLKKFDKDGDGKISTEEKKAIAEEWKKRFAGRKPHRPQGRRPRPEGGRPEGRPERSKRPEGRKPRPSKKK